MLERLQRDCDLNRQRTSAAESSVAVPYMEVEVVMVEGSNLELKNATLRKELNASSKTHAEVEPGLAKDLGETLDDLRKKKIECDAPKAKVGKLGKGLESLRDALKVAEKSLAARIASG